MESQQTVSARATENRRTNRIVDAVAEIVGRETAERMMDDIESREETPEREGAGAKLARLRESSRGRAWLEAHPDASWEDIERVPL